MFMIICMIILCRKYKRKPIKPTKMVHSIYLYVANVAYHIHINMAHVDWIILILTIINLFVCMSVGARGCACVRLRV